MTTGLRLFCHLHGGSILNKDGFVCIWHDRTLDLQASFALSVDRSCEVENFRAIVFSVYGQSLRHYM